MRIILVSMIVAAALSAPAATGNGSPYSPGLVQGLPGVVAPPGAVRYVTLGEGRWTAVAAIDEATGRVRRTMTLRGLWGIPIVTYDGSTGGLSGDARTLVVSGYGPLPGEPGTTRLAVLNARTLGLRRLITLRGSWSYDASSPDGAMLFLVEHLSAGERPRYRVRAYDVTRGRLLAKPVVDRGTSAVMGGRPATRVGDRGGRWAYTLYARTAERPFVHALDTISRRAFCIDVPVSVPTQRQLWLRLQLRGARLVVTDPGGKRVAVVDTRTFVARAA